MSFKKLKVYIHVAKMNSWEAILLELLEDIRISKLKAEVTLVSVGGDIPEFTSCRTVNTKLPLSQFEFPTLELLYDEIEDDTAICYTHLKGVSVPDSLGHRFWRREMSEFVFINWKQRIYHLSLNWTSGPRITNGGAGWHSDYVNANKHYSGNFWWARSDYLKTLIHPSKFRSNRYAAEAWLGQSVLINEPIN